VQVLGKRLLQKIVNKFNAVNLFLHGPLARLISNPAARFPSKSGSCESVKKNEGIPEG